MKRLLSLLLAAVLLLSLASCNEADESRKDFQNYDELEHKSDDLYSDDEVLTYSHKDGTFALGREMLISIKTDRTCEVIPFAGEGYAKYTDVTMPFGVSTGDKLEKLISAYSLDTGFASYVKKGGALQMFDSEKKPDMSDGEGGCMYFAFALTPEGKWAYMDHTMLGQMMEGVVVMQSDKDYDVIVCSAIVDDSETITQITVLYGEINQIMAILNA